MAKQQPGDSRDSDKLATTIATTIVNGSDPSRNACAARDYSDELWTHHCAPFKDFSYKSLSFFNKDPACHVGRSVVSVASVSASCASASVLARLVVFFRACLLACSRRILQNLIR